MMIIAFTDENAGIYDSSLYTSIFIFYQSMWLLGCLVFDNEVVCIKNLELVGVMLIEVSNRHTHYPIVVAGNICDLIYVDCIIVVVVGIPLWAVFLVESELLVSLREI